MKCSEETEKRRQLDIAESKAFSSSSKEDEKEKAEVDRSTNHPSEQESPWVFEGRADDEKDQARQGSRIQDAVGYPQMIEVGDDQHGGDNHHCQMSDQKRTDSDGRCQSCKCQPHHDSQRELPPSQTAAAAAEGGQRPFITTTWTGQSGMEILIAAGLDRPSVKQGAKQEPGDSKEGGDHGWATLGHAAIDVMLRVSTGVELSGLTRLRRWSSSDAASESHGRESGARHSDPLGSR